MKIETRHVGDIVILDCSGKITLGEGTMAVRRTVRDLLKTDSKKILLNLADVNYIDASGIGELVSVYTTAFEAGGVVKLFNPSAKILELLNITKLAAMYSIFENERAAVASYR